MAVQRSVLSTDWHPFYDARGVRQSEPCHTCPIPRCPFAAAYRTYTCALAVDPVRHGPELAPSEAQKVQADTRIDLNWPADRYYHNFATGERMRQSPRRVPNSAAWLGLANI